MLEYEQVHAMSTVSFWFRSNRHFQKPQWRQRWQCNRSLSELGFESMDSKTLQFKNVSFQKHSRFEQVCQGDTTFQHGRFRENTSKRVINPEL